MNDQNLAAALSPHACKSASTADAPFKVPPPGTDAVFDAGWRRIRAAKSHWLAPEEWNFVAKVDGRLMLSAGQLRRLQAIVSRLEELDASKGAR